MRFLKLIIPLLIFSCCSHSSFEFDTAYNRTVRLLKKDSITTALDVCQVAIDKARRADDLGKAYWMMGYLYDMLDNAPKAQRYYLEASDVYSSTSDNRSAMLLIRNAGTVALNANAFSIAIEHYRSALDYAVQLKDDYYQVVGNYELGLAFLKNRNLDSANHYQNNVLDLVDDLDSMAAKAYLELGLIQFHLANYDSARFLYEKALTRYSDEVIDYKIAQNIANSYLVEGNYKMAEPALRRALEKGRILGNNRGIIKPINCLGQLYAELGNRDSAVHYLSMVYEISESYSNPTDRRQNFALELSRNPLHDLGSNYKILKKLDPQLADKIADEYILDHLVEYLNSMEVLSKQERVHAIQIANSNRDRSRMLKRIEKYQKEEAIKNWLLGLFIVIAILTTVFILRNKKESIYIAHQKIKASQKRMKRINS